MGNRAQARRFLPAFIAPCVALLVVASGTLPAEANHLCGGIGATHQCSHEPPTARFEITPESPARRAPITLVSTSRSNPDRTLTRTSWDLDGDGAFDDAAGETASTSFATDGPRTIGVEVVDSEGASDIATRAIDVATPAIDPPDELGTSALHMNPQHNGYEPDSRVAPPLRRQWERTFDFSFRYPLMADGKVFVIVAGGRDFRLDHLGSVVHALDERTGRTIWTRRVAASRVTPAYADGRLYLASGDVVLGLDGDTGRTLMAHDMRGDSPIGALVAGDGLVYASGIHNGLQAIDAESGEIAWWGSGGYAGRPALGPNELFSSGDCGTQADDRFSGASQWRAPLDCGGGSYMAPAHSDGLLFSLEDRTAQDQLQTGRVLDAGDGTPLRSFETTQAPSVAGPITLLSSPARLSATRSGDGSTLWSAPLPGQLKVDPIILGGTVYVARSGRSGSGLFALDLATGREVWRDGLDGRLGGDFVEFLEPGPEVTLVGSETHLVAGFENSLIAFADRVPPDGDPDENPDATNGAHELMASIPQAETDPGSYPTFAGDAARQGFNNTTTFGPHFERAWSVPAPGAELPLIDDGMVFVASEGAPGPDIAAYDVDDGGKAWGLDLGDDRLSPALGAGRLFVVSDRGVIWALEPSTGEIVWTRRPDGYVAGGTGPVVVGGVLYVRFSGVLRGFRASDGEPTAATGSFGGMPTISDGVLFSAASGPQITAETIDGDADVNWRLPSCCSGGGTSVPVVHDGLLYTGAGLSESYVIEASTGVVRDGYESTTPTPAFAGRIGVFADGARVWAADARTMATLWVRRLDYAVDRGPTIVGRNVFVLGTDGVVYSIDLASGALEWGAKLAGPVEEFRPSSDQSAIATGERVIAVTSDERLNVMRPVSPGRAAPQTSITEAPSGILDSRVERHRLEFTSDDPGAEFECRTADADGALEFEACSSPTRFSAGGVRGPASIEVRAIDADGVVDPTPAFARFTVDRNSPQVLVSGPRKTRDRTPTIRIQTDEPARLFCSSTRFAERRCGARFTLPRQRPGSVTVQVRAVDRAHNELWFPYAYRLRIRR